MCHPLPYPVIALHVIAIACGIALLSGIAISLKRCLVEWWIEGR